jgi:hypothetical protein
VAPALAREAARHPDQLVHVWVHFTDRAGSERDAAAFAAARAALPARSLERRARRGTLRDLVASDLPVHASYVRALIERGATLRGTSRWLNAASVEIPARLVREFATLPFVARIEPVARGRRIEPVIEPPAPPAHGETGVESRGAMPALMSSPGDTAYYGASFRQLQMIQVPALHAMGLSGAGVIVCMIDTGFHLAHRAFASLQVIAARDFIHQDSNVDDQSGQDIVGQANHGTMTLACVAGSRPGTFSGGAFGATVALAKTEDIPTETPVEMDYWQFAAEWADSLGADVISSSLGYSQFDDSTQSYTYADMDGRTTVVTRAAVEAARRGITVVTAAGNEGGSPWHYIVAPGDADSVITSGAVDSMNVLAGFSSRGPTADGRFKPDVTAMGRNVFTVSPVNDSTYVRVSGTSFSTPLTAGLVALLLEAHPAWGPFEVREALRRTALNHGSPNTDIGWGLVQGQAAWSWVPGPTAVSPQAGATSLALAAGPSPARTGARLAIRFAAPAGARARIEVFDLAGRRRVRLFEGAAAGATTVPWTGTAADGSRLPAGVYWIRMEANVAGRSRESRAVRVVLLP